MPFVLHNPGGWTRPPRKRKAPQFAKRYLYEIRFPPDASWKVSAEIERIQRNVHCMVKRTRMIPELDIDGFTVYVKDRDDLFAVRMATAINDVVVYLLHTPVPRPARAVASAP